MTKASPARAEKKVAKKKDPRAAAKADLAAQAAKKSEEPKAAPELTGQEVVQLLQILENAPTGNRAQRQILAGIENKLVAMAVAMGAIHQPGAPVPQ